jgi:tetratricopeptide (TPR) repeat protein
MRNHWIGGVCALLLLSGPALVYGQTVSDLLEKAAYQEKTAGDLDAAIKIYQSIIDQEKAARPAMAQAYFRMGQCLAKKGEKDKATEAFKAVINNYSDQKTLAAEAQKELTKLANGGLAPKPPYPVVVRTTPEAFDDHVSPALTELTVVFDRPMLDKTWSWTGGGETYPQPSGDIHYDATKTQCSMPVKLEPGKVYRVGINSPSHKNFQTPARVPAQRYIILFATANAEGKPTPIPEELLAQAKAINAASKAAAEAPIPASHRDLLDAETRQAVEHFDQSFGGYFGTEPAYQAANEKGRAAIIDKWIAEAKSKDFDRRVRAIASLGNVRARKAVPVLLAIVDEPMNNQRPKWMAIRALGRLGERSAVPLFIELVDYGNKNVQVYARAGLADITGVYFGADKDKWRQWWKENGSQPAGSDKTPESQPSEARR